MKPQNVNNQKGDVIFARPPIINCKFRATERLARDEFPMCLSCKLATSKRRSPEVKTSKLLASKTGNLSRDCYEPGDQINTDQFNVQTPGRLCSGYGRDAPENSYHGGTIFQDSASNLVRVQPQVSLSAGEKVLGKAAFKEWIWNLAGVLAKKYHSDN